VAVTGRHATQPPPERRTPPSARPYRRGSSALAGSLVALAAVGFTTLTLLGVVSSGVDLRPRGAVEAEPTPTPSATVSQVALVATPAQAAVQATLTAAIPGWGPASAISWTGGTPFDTGCGRPTPDAALTGSRVYDSPGGQAVVTVSAYSAGAGAVAFHDWSTRLVHCTGTPVSASVVAAPGADAVVATIAPVGGRPGASALLWRRGDVIASVATPTVTAIGLAARAVAVDSVLLGALTGRCADVASTLADAARTPWIDSGTFTGLTVPVTVSVTPSPTPVPPPGVTPVPDSYTPAPLPSVSLPTRPADPVWPTDVPAPVGSPVAPVRPLPAPASTVVASRLDDPVGPGCGWAFTGQVPPPYDAAREASVAQDAADQAQAQLVIKQQSWQSDVVSYWQQQPIYEQQAQAFLAYASTVQQVALAWDTITRQREDYAAAVAAYDAATVARSQFFSEQAAAQTAYDDALAACGPTTTPSPTPTPSDSLSPSPTGTLSASPSTPGCPPALPPILGQAPPTLPPIPAPPPDPRPSPS
jgi:hypothetical protein